MSCRLLGLRRRPPPRHADVRAGAGQGQARDKLRYGQIVGSVKSVSSLALYTAQRKGFLARENIDLEVVRLPGVHHMIEGLDKNIVDVSHTATPYLIEGVLKGSGTVGVVGGPANTIFSVIAKPGIKSFADLKGKMFAMSLPVDTISIASRLLLAKHGLKEHRLPHHRADRHADPRQMPDRRRMRRGAARPARRHRVRRQGLHQARRLARGDPGAAVQRDRRAPRLGGTEQGRGGALRPRVRRRLSLHARSEEPRRGHARS